MNRHDCRPDEHQADWHGSGWAGTSYDCPHCGSHWYVDVSYRGPGFANAVYTWTHEDD